MIDKEVLAIAIRQAQSEASEVVAISALRESTLAPLLEKAGAVLARNLGGQPDESERYSEAVSRIA
ncbi:MAG: hypothetical protein DMF69_01590 [Acidobacteria bacterium]|nr:MAG: hypothetical protein DMF69_01590 [Acidobacteriota bacterium]